MREYFKMMEELRARDGYREFANVEYFGGGRGRVDGRDVTVFCNNDYLDLSHDPRLAEAAVAATKTGGTGAGASRYVSGNHPLYSALEAMTAETRRQEACQVFGSGYAANLAVIPSFAVAGDVIFSDERNHASIIDGCRLSRAETRVYRHADYDHLETMLKEVKPDRQCWIVTESLFSIQGDEADLRRLAELKDRYGAGLIVDDAHAGGAIGPQGGGLPVETGLAEHIDLVIGTYSKAYGSLGGHVCGKREWMDFLRNTARTGIFSTGLPAGVLAAGLRAMEIVSESWDTLQGRLRSVTEQARASLIKLGLAKPAGNRYIVPLHAGENGRALEAAAALLESGHLARAIRPPTVPEGEACLRVSLSVGHRADDIAAFTAAAAATKALA